MIFLLLLLKYGVQRAKWRVEGSKCQHSRFSTHTGARTHLPQKCVCIKIDWGSGKGREDKWIYNGGQACGEETSTVYFENLIHLSSFANLSFSILSVTNLSPFSQASLCCKPLFYRPGIVFRVQAGTEAGGLLSKQVFHGAMLTCMIASVCLFVRRSRFFLYQEYNGCEG